MRLGEWLGVKNGRTAIGVREAIAATVLLG
jgi:hypothetical protein